MKRFIFYVSFLLSPFFLNAQTTQMISLGPDISLPFKKSFGASTDVSLGGSLQYQLKFAGPVGIQIHAGFNHFKDGYGGKVNFLPVRIGAVGYLYQDLIAVYADGGISRYHSPTTGTTQNGFSLGLGAGYRLPVGEKQFVQISAYYNLHHFKLKETYQDYNYNWINLRVAFGFLFTKKQGNPREE